MNYYSIELKSIKIRGRRERYPGTDGYRVPARKKFMGTDGYRVPARKKILGTDGYRVPRKFSLMPTPVNKIIYFERFTSDW